MSEYVRVLFDQKLVELRIGTCDCDIKKRTRKRHLIDVGTKFDITAEKTTHLGGQVTSMDKAHVICSQTTFGYFPACSNKCTKREFNLVPIQTSRNANKLQNHINFSPFANRSATPHAPPSRWSRASGACRRRCRSRPRPRPSTIRATTGAAVNLITEDPRASIRRLFPLMILPFVAMLGGALSASNIDGGVEHDHCP